MEDKEQPLMEDKEQLKIDWHNLLRASEAALMNGKDRDAVRAAAQRIAVALGVHKEPESEREIEPEKPVVVPEPAPVPSPPRE